MRTHEPIACSRRSNGRSREGRSATRGSLTWSRYHWLRSGRSAGTRVRGSRFTVGLHAELEVAFALESADSGRWLTEEYAQERSVAAGDLLGTALTRLHHRTDGATVYRDGPLGSELYLVRQRDGLDASRLLLTPLWEKISAATNAPLVIAAPSRDRVYAAPSDQPHSIERLIERVREDWSTRPHPTSTRLWVCRRARLEPWHPTPDVSRETL